MEANASASADVVLWSMCDWRSIIPPPRQYYDAVYTKTYVQMQCPMLPTPTPDVPQLNHLATFTSFSSSMPRLTKPNCCLCLDLLEVSCMMVEKCFIFCVYDLISVFDKIM